MTSPDRKPEEHDTVDLDLYIYIRRYASLVVQCRLFSSPTVNGSLVSTIYSK